MGCFHVYCALCGGPFQLYWEPRENSQRSYDPDVLDDPEDPELAWLSEFRVIGENPEAEGPTKIWISGPAIDYENGAMNYEPGDPPDPALPEPGDVSVYQWEPDEPWAAPFHTCCREVLCRYLCISVSHLDKEVFFETLYSMAERDTYATSLEIDYGDVMDGMEQYWWTERDMEHFVFNPVVVKGLKGFLANLPQRNVSIDRPATAFNTRGDPFATLPPDILLIIMTHLKKMATVFEARRASPAFANIELTNSFWRNRIHSDMPWLWDLPGAITEQQRNETDWQFVYRKLYWGSKGFSQKKNKIYGLCNRRRIWEQLCPIFADAYLEIEARPGRIRAITPTILDGASNLTIGS